MVCQRPPALLAHPPASLVPSSSSALRAKAPPFGYLAPLGSFIPTSAGWLYLAVVIALCSRKIVGWSLADNLRADLVIDALQQALGSRRARFPRLSSTATVEEAEGNSGAGRRASQQPVWQRHLPRAPARGGDAPKHVRARQSPSQRLD